MSWWDANFSSATVVTMYLLPELNHQLRPQILKMKPGTRVVSYQWDMGEWEPDETFRAADTEAFLWIVPANAAGRWTLREENGFVEGRLDIEQKFQRIGGTITLRGEAQPLLGAYVHGDTLGFTFVHHDSGIRSVRVRIDDNAFAGSLSFAGNLTSISGRRR